MQLYKDDTKYHHYYIKYATNYLQDNHKPQLFNKLIYNFNPKNYRVRLTTRNNNMIIMPLIYNEHLAVEYLNNPDVAP